MKLGFMTILLTMGQSGLTKQIPSVYIVIKKLILAQLVKRTSMLQYFQAFPKRVGKKKQIPLAGSEVLTAVVMKSSLFCGITL
jgi:hypothetical protein